MNSKNLLSLGFPRAEQCLTRRLGWHLQTHSILKLSQSMRYLTSSNCWSLVRLAVAAHLAVFIASSFDVG